MRINSGPHYRVPVSAFLACRPLCLAPHLFPPSPPRGIVGYPATSARIAPRPSPASTHAFPRVQFGKGGFWDRWLLTACPALKVAGENKQVISLQWVEPGHSLFWDAEVGLPKSSCSGTEFGRDRFWNRTLRDWRGGLRSLSLPRWVMISLRNCLWATILSFDFSF